MHCGSSSHEEPFGSEIRDASAENAASDPFAEATLHDCQVSQNDWSLPWDDPLLKNSLLETSPARSEGPVVSAHFQPMEFCYTPQQFEMQNDGESPAYIPDTSPELAPQISKAHLNASQPVPSLDEEKPQTSTKPTETQWTSHKEMIRELYMSGSLPSMMKIMKERDGFEAS